MPPPPHTKPENVLKVPFAPSLQTLHPAFNDIIFPFMSIVTDSNPIQASARAHRC